MSFTKEKLFMNIKEQCDQLANQAAVIFNQKQELEQQLYDQGMKSKQIESHPQIVNYENQLSNLVKQRNSLLGI